MSAVQERGYTLIPGSDTDIHQSDGSESSPSPSHFLFPGSQSDMSEGDRERLHNESAESQLPSRSKPESSKLQRCLCILAAIFFVLLLASAIVVLVLLLVVVGQQPARVLTTCGLVEGQYDMVNKVFSFKGIPYADVKRWSPPANQTCWRDVYKAERYRPECSQYNPITKQYSGREDCLFLNVFTPMVDPMTPLPVMVYIHGGFLQLGNASTPGYAPDERVTNQMQVVFVSIQYRLGALGYLVSDALPGRRGNYGFLDQVKALEWVRDNIAGFGGDPKQVTIFGQSSGATSVWALLMSPLARGLFSRAWLLSGSPLYNATTADAAAANAWLVEGGSPLEAQCHGNVTEECLMGLSAEDIQKVVFPHWNAFTDSMDLPTRGTKAAPLAVVDGEFMPAAPFAMWENESYRGVYSDVPVVIGTTAQEVDLSPAPGQELKAWDKSELYHYISLRLGDALVNATLALYPWKQEGDAERLFTSMASDIRVNCGNDILAEKASAALSSPVYRYVATAKPSTPVFPLGPDGFEPIYAFHTWDLVAFFWAYDKIFLRRGPSSADLDFGRTLQKQMGSFVRSGAPEDADWLVYPNVTALVSKEMNYVDAYNQQQCQFWLNNDFYGYSWIN